MIADTWTSIKAYLYDRNVSPLLGSIVVSWSIWNYKFYLLLVSSLTFPDKLRYLNILYSGYYECLFQGFIFPLLTAAFYIFAFPYPAELVYRFSLSKQKKLVTLKNEIEENTLLTIEQSRAIRHELFSSQEVFEEQLKRKDNAIEIKDSLIQDLEKRNSDLEEQLQTIKEDREESKYREKAQQARKTSAQSERPTTEERIIQLIKLPKTSHATTEDEYMSYILKAVYEAKSMSVNRILQEFQDQVKAQYYIDELINLNFLEKSGRSSSNSVSLPHNINGIFVKNM